MQEMNLELRRGLLLVFMGLIAGLLAPHGQAANMPDQAGQMALDSNAYRLGAGDVINIVVYGEDD